MGGAWCLAVWFAAIVSITAAVGPQSLGTGALKLRAPNELTPRSSHAMLGRSFWKSDELGVAHCSLQGVLGGEDVILHVWLRVAPPSVVANTQCRLRPDDPTCNSTALARGFALLQSARRSVPTGGPVGLQLLQAGSIDMFSKDIYLRSSVSRAKYPLNLTVYNSSRFRKWDPEHPAEGWTNHVMDLHGELPLKPQDVDQVDFELRASGFDWHCPFLIEPPVLGQRRPGTGRFSGGGDQHANDANKEESYLPPWTHHQKSSLSKNTQVWQLLSPFYRVTTHDYAVMLWHRVLWHAQLGVSRYLLYVYESLSPLLKEPLIQELVMRGTLQVVLYTEMPKHERRPLHPTATDLYTMQVLAYNHALLALWGSDSLVLVADVDEYVITHKPMSVVDLFTECRNTTSPELPSAGLQLRRTDAMCAPHVGPEVCTPSVPGLLFWTNVSLDEVKSGRAPHPLSWHAMGEANDLWEHHNTKPLVDPNLSRDVHVHFFKGAANTSKDASNTSCVRLLHLVDLYKVRHSRSPAPIDSVSSGNRRWWWPVNFIRRSVWGSGNTGMAGGQGTSAGAHGQGGHGGPGHGI